MIFDKGDDLRGCTVRLRYMKPGESLTIPMDAERIERRTCVEYIRGRICAFQETSDGAYPSGQDIMEVLQRPHDAAAYAATRATRAALTACAARAAYAADLRGCTVRLHPETQLDLISEVHCTAKAALKALLDDAEAREYGPPVPAAAVADLEWIIHATSSEGEAWQC